MNYELKYLKYKMKYLNLKKSVKNYDFKGGNDLYHDKLKKEYPYIVGDISSNNKNSTPNNNLTYGEMTYEGINSLHKLLETDFNCFIDIGSGRGKLPLWFAGINGINKSIGIEILEKRHKYAQDLKSKLSKLSDFQDIISKVELIGDSVFNVDLSYLKKSKFKFKVLVWISNLCFNEEMNKNLFRKIASELPSGTIIACSQTVPDDLLQQLNIDKHIISNNINTIQIHMTWTPNSTVYLYRIK